VQFWHFGCSVDMMAKLWWLIEHKWPEVNDTYERQHLLWALGFLKVYSTEDVQATQWHVDRATFRTHYQPFVWMLSRLDCVSAASPFALAGTCMLCVLVSCRDLFARALRTQLRSCRLCSTEARLAVSAAWLHARRH